MNNRVDFLDGLRGWGAAMVVLSHVFQVWLLNPAGLEQSGNSWLLKVINFSPLGVATDGTLAVHIFFTVSGFALSYPILTSRNRTSRLLNMAAFRYPRLAIPVLMSALFAFALWGALANVEAARLSSSEWLASFYQFAPSWSGLLKFSAYDAFFAYDGETSWNANLWTMPIELAGSAGIFLFLLIAPTPLLRGVGAAGFILLNWQNSFACFATGYLIAEFIYIPGRRSTPAGLAMFAAALILAVYIRATHSASIPRYDLISALVVSAVAISAPLQNLFSCSLSERLGRISFSLYLVHLPIICSLGSRLYIHIEPSAGFLGAAALIGPIVIAASMIAAVAFHWLVEDKILPSVKSGIASIVEVILLRSSQQRCLAVLPAIIDPTDCADQCGSRGVHRSKS